MNIDANTPSIAACVGVRDLLVDAIERRHLLACRADHGVDVGAGAGLERRRDLTGIDVAVDHRPERRKRIGEFLLQAGDLALRSHEPCERQRFELSPLRPA